MAKSSGNAGSLFYGMSLDTKEFKKKLKDARKALKSAGDEMRETFTAIGKGFAIAGGAIAAGTTGLFLFAKSTAEATNEQILLADSIGATQAEIAGLSLASTRWGVSQDMLIDKMREAGGIEAFKDIADQVKSAGNETAQLAKAQELLGNEGLKLLPILQQGAGGLAAMEQEAVALGLALSPEQIAQNNVAWGKFENTMLKIEGLSKQLGTSFLEFFGTASAGVDGLIDAFGTDIKAAFKSTADFLTDSMTTAFQWFAENGIPFINGFIRFANNIGEAFSNIFGFIKGEGSSTFNFIGELFDSFVDFMATFKQTLIAGITGSISTVINGAFGLLSKFNTFVGEQVEGLAALVQMIPGVSKDLSKNVREAFSEQSESIENFGKELSKPFADISEDQTNEAAKILEEQRKKNEEQSKKFIDATASLSADFKKAGEVAGDVAKTNESAAKAVAGLSDQRTSIAITGSQEEFRIRQGGQQLALQQKQLSEMKKTRIALERLGTA